MVNNMRRNNRPKYYEAGGLLEMLTRSSPTMSFEQRSKDQVARDLLRNEAGESPQMTHDGGGRDALRRASGGMIPGYAFGGSMAGAYGGSQMKATSPQPFGQQGGGWGNAKTFPSGGTTGIGQGFSQGFGQQAAPAQPFGQQGGGWGSTPTAPAQTGFIQGQSGGKSQFLPAGGWGNAKAAPSGGITGIGSGFGQQMSATPQQQFTGGPNAPSFPELSPEQIRANVQGAYRPDRSYQEALNSARARVRQVLRPEFAQEQMDHVRGGVPGPGYKDAAAQRADLEAQYGDLDKFLANTTTKATVGGEPGQSYVDFNDGAGPQATEQAFPGGVPQYNALLNPGSTQPPPGFGLARPASQQVSARRSAMPTVQFRQDPPFVPPPPTFNPPPPPPPPPPSNQTYQARPLPDGYGSPTSYAGYGTPLNFDSRQEFVSPEVASQYADLTDSIMQVGTKPYEQYEGEQLASFTDMEDAAQAAYGAYGTGVGPQGTRQSESTLDQAATSLMGTGTDAQSLAAASAVRAREIGDKDTALGLDADMTKYMSDYTQNVTDPQLQQLMEFQRQQGQELGSQAASAGAFGGYRQGIMQGQQAQDAAQQAASIIGKGQQEAFQSAISREQEDARRTEQGYTRDLSAENQAAAREAEAQGQMLSASQSLANVGGQQTTLGQQQQAQQMQRLAEMQKAGASRRQLEQAQLDLQKRQWEQEQQRPERQVAWMNQQLGQLPYQNVVQQGSYGPQASKLSTTIGAGLQGAGMAQAWMAGQPPQQPQEEFKPTWKDKLGAYAGSFLSGKLGFGDTRATLPTGSIFEGVPFNNYANTTNPIPENNVFQGSQLGTFVNPARGYGDVFQGAKFGQARDPYAGISNMSTPRLRSERQGRST
jgi:hypothetical protein